MKRPSARDFFLSEIMPQFSSKTYEEYLYEYSQEVGRLKTPNAELPDWTAEHPLESLEFSNSVEINIICKDILRLKPELQPFLNQCFIALVPETLINATAFYRTDLYDGYIIQINAGIVVWLTVFLAPLVTMCNFMDNRASKEDRNVYQALFEKQMTDLAYLKNNHNKYTDVNKLSLPYFPYDEMWLEHTYYKIAALTFIVLHEIAHHALLHTERRYSTLFKSDLPDYIQGISNDNHRMELEADYFALCTVLQWVKGTFGPEHKPDKEISVNSFQIGPILAFMGLAYLYDKFEIESDTHPSLEKRLRASISFYLANFSDYDQNTGMFMTKIYAHALFGESSKVTSCWDNWQQSLLNKA